MKNAFLLQGELQQIPLNYKILFVVLGIHCSRTVRAYFKRPLHKAHPGLMRDPISYCGIYWKVNEKRALGRHGQSDHKYM
jgi:hypothetical protein